MSIELIRNQGDKNSEELYNTLLNGKCAIVKIFRNNSRNFPEILFKNVQSISRNLPKFISKFFEGFFEFFAIIL